MGVEFRAFQPHPPIFHRPHQSLALLLPKEMGIQGLLPLLKSIMAPIHLKDLDGCSVAVDTYSWLHKGALSCSTQLCKGLPTSRHIDYCMHRVNLLRHNGVKPILVFDGGFLPMKGEQETKRARSRKDNLARAIEHEANGNTKGAYECYQKAVDISPAIAHELIQVLKRENVQYVVAPYEADAQMTFLAISNQVDAVITEDSDLIPFGCPRIIFKMDKFGQGVEFRQSLLHQNRELSLAGFTKQMLLEMCILSGCDYLPSLPGMGLKRAHALIKQFKSYDKVIKHLRYSTVSVPPLYEDSFKKAILTFQHQRVYDPVVEDLVHLSDISDNIGDDLDFLGPCLPQHIAKGIAKGDVDPVTLMPFQGERTSTSLKLDAPSQLKNIKNESGRKNLDLPVQKNLLTKYFCFASLEAKRSFRAPRISPKPPSPTNNPIITIDDDLAVDTAADNRNCSPASSSSPGTENSTIVLPPQNSVVDGFATEVPTSPESPKHCTVDKMLRSEHACLQQPSQLIHRPCQVLHNERNTKIVQDAIKGTDTRRVIVRSSYFKNKPVQESDQGSKKETRGDCTNTTENAIPKGVSFKNYSFDGATLKRKNTPDENVEMENIRSKVMRTNEPCPGNEMQKEEENFGSNISHLDRYSDIAEKSMERFVSVISSFRYNPSGSRASGLRAPLKDVLNTETNRSNIGADFSQFTFVPSNRKPTSRRQR